MKKSEIKFVQSWVSALDGEARLNESQIGQLQRLLQFCAESNIGFEVKTGSPFENVSMQKIVELSAKYHGVPAWKLTGRIRTFEVVKARDFAAITIYDSRQITLTEVAKFFNRDHTTLVHSRRKIENMYGFEDELHDFHEWLLSAISGKFGKKAS